MDSELDNFRVVVRVRPLAAREKEQVAAYADFLAKRKPGRNRLSPSAYAFHAKYPGAPLNELVQVFPRSVCLYDQEYKNTEKRAREYGYSRVHGQTDCNRQVFEQSLKPLVSSVLQGYNCTVLAYGITGSGKTYSVFGHPRLQQDKGLSLLSFQYLIQKSRDMEKDGVIVNLGFSFLQIYNENLRDLLSEDGKKFVGIHEDSRGMTQMPDALEISVRSLEHLSQLISTGAARRISASTHYNQASSRSHAVLRMSVQLNKDGNKTSSKFFIIDLAGSEKAQIENSTRKHEGSNINRSLLSLGNCISALAQGARNHVPYRDSKLTRLLKDSLGGNARTLMIACISPHPFTLDETATTLNYAQRAQGIRKDVLPNYQKNPRILCASCQAKPPQVDSVLPSFRISKDQTSNIFVDIIERIYADILENAREGQRLSRMESLMSESCSQYENVKKNNQQERDRLKGMLISLLQGKTQSSPAAEQQLERLQPQKSQRRKIIISNSSKKERQRRSQTQNGDGGNTPLQSPLQSQPFSRVSILGSDQKKQTQCSRQQYWTNDKRQWAEARSPDTRDDEGCRALINSSGGNHKRSRSKFQVVKRRVPSQMG